MTLEIETVTFGIICTVFGIVAAPYLWRLIRIIINKAQSTKNLTIVGNTFEFDTDNGLTSGVLDLSKEIGCVKENQKNSDVLLDRFFSHVVQTEKEELQFRYKIESSLDDFRFRFDRLHADILKIRILQYIEHYPSETKYINELWQACQECNPKVNHEVEAAYNKWQKQYCNQYSEEEMYVR